MRVKHLPFLPKSINFSDLAPNQENTYYDETEEDKRDIEIDKEIMLLKAMHELSSDKEKCVMLLEILREYGYQIDYESAAQALNINWRWFMRVKRNVRMKVNKITTNT